MRCSYLAEECCIPVGVPAPETSALPGSPLSPLAPLSPGTPLSPLSPGGPLEPGVPCGPTAPAGPGIKKRTIYAVCPFSSIFTALDMVYPNLSYVPPSHRLMPRHMPALCMDVLVPWQSILYTTSLQRDSLWLTIILSLQMSSPRGLTFTLLGSSLPPQPSSELKGLLKMGYRPWLLSQGAVELNPSSP